MRTNTTCLFRVIIVIHTVKKVIKVTTVTKFSKAKIGKFLDKLLTDEKTMFFMLLKLF